LIVLQFLFSVTAELKKQIEDLPAMQQLLIDADAILIKISATEQVFAKKAQEERDKAQVKLRKTLCHFGVFGMMLQSYFMVFLIFSLERDQWTARQH
jgi:hypothetical protein